MDYSGTADTTIGGLTCQAWSVQEPHGHDYSDVGNHNYCRVAAEAKALAEGKTVVTTNGTRYALGRPAKQCEHHHRRVVRAAHLRVPMRTADW